jgi:hypothetical protein
VFGSTRISELRGRSYPDRGHGPCHCAMPMVRGRAGLVRRSA